MSSEISTNSSNLTHSALTFALDYRVIATVLHSIIFVAGVFGNTAMIVVVCRTRSLRTPTYHYLVSLAVADLIVLLSAMPEAIVSYHQRSGEWVFGGSVGCSLAIFLNFLGINSSSLSILCFTMERYIGICHPLLQKKVCSVERARKIIIGTWMVALCYCSPWLGLTVVRTIPYQQHPPMDRCELRLRRDQYVLFFMTDLFLFYILPLLVSVLLYFKIGLALRESMNAQPSSGSKTVVAKRRTGPPSEALHLQRHICKSMKAHRGSTIQVVRMLLLIVSLFALLWLPYRGLLVYNSFAQKPWLNIWYVLFAKTCIFINAAINPILYNVMSRKFRTAFVQTVFCRKGYGRSAHSTRSSKSTSARCPVTQHERPSTYYDRRESNFPEQLKRRPSLAYRHQFSVPSDEKRQGGGLLLDIETKAFFQQGHSTRV